MSQRTDVAVVGLGLIGAAALRHLARAGVAPVGIGPGEPEDWASHGGVFASHYDSGRITRKLDARFEWAELARRSIAEYPTIARDGGVEFHHPVGTVFASADESYLAALDHVGRRVGADHRVLDGTVAGPLALPTGTTVVSEPAPAGFVDPRRMLRAQLAAARAAGARTVAEEVTRLESQDGRTSIQADETYVEATTVILATGAHTGEVGPPFTGRVRPETIVLATIGPAEQDRLAGMPSVLAHLDGSPFRDLYQVPPAPYPDGTVKLKLGATLRAWEPLATGAARRSWMAGNDHEALLPDLRALVEGLVPGLRAESWDTKPCMITETPSGVPTVDLVRPGLVLAAGGNGFAAKSADAIGALAAGLALDGRWTDTVLDSEPFRAAPTASS